MQAFMASNKRLYIPPRMEAFALMQEACLLGCSKDDCEHNKGIFDDIGMTPFDNSKKG